MKLDISDKTASFGLRPHIPKGFYPGKLVEVKPHKDKDGNLIEKKFGKQLIFSYAVYKTDKEGKPTEPMKYKPDKESLKEEDVILASFVYHMYKDKASGEYRTAITPNSRITKNLLALGWTFPKDITKGIELDELIGNWVELGVDDYDQKLQNTDDTYKASGIIKISKYEGPEPGEVKEASPKKPKEVKKEMKHSRIEEFNAIQKQVKEIEARKEEMESMRDSGDLTEKGYKKSIELLDAKLEEVKAK